ncbi:putative F420-dependent oxidoreductase [Salinarchaeum sp. Harcht-Bsk1]|uniref:TIGR03560 family F420-dependent LLM class oxidoreductase n=1 Tax=Salinarchaeum sp. Harcht-Bsk1 TaxID=1333523 RepID=UPI00034242A6|nr:TIGR03560 family F420-dependent LLM class oxidoreductase [Salinarchaeum sp. Harcht-Bsk1]AGN02375.1 putative F420-dependent oxidoreductase [Salinarchaeum sp. Harcht-Bsk1]
MDFGYHNASFEYADDPESRSLVDSLVDRAQLVEDAGFTWFSLMDHFWQLQWSGHLDEDFVECYSGLSALATATDDIDLSALVTCIHYRNPAYLAKVVASLDQLSEGRAILGIGAGWYEDEYDAIGVPFEDPAKRIRELRDVIKLCQTAWDEDSPVNYEGQYHDLDDLILEPKPDDVPILVGGGGEQLTLRVTAEYADMWNIPGSDPETYEHKLGVLKEHCENAGRDYDEITKTATITTMIRDTTEEAHEAYEDHLEASKAGPADRDEFRGLVGTPEEVAEGVETYQDLGIDSFQIQVPKNERETTVRFIDEVAPQF